MAASIRAPSMLWSFPRRLARRDAPGPSRSAKYSTAYRARLMAMRSAWTFRGVGTRSAHVHARSILRSHSATTRGPTTNAGLGAHLDPGPRGGAERGEPGRIQLAYQGRAPAGAPYLEPVGEDHERGAL